jgi:PAS domain S-box-containing protein
MKGWGHCYPNLGSRMQELSKEALLERARTLERRIAELEARAADDARAAEALQKESVNWRMALMRSEATARALFESAAEAILLVETSGRIVLANAAAERMFGYTSEELIGSELELLLPDHARPRHVEHRQRFFAEPRARPMGIGLDLAGRRRDGSEFPLEISLSHVESEDGILGLAFITDITARKRSESQLQRQRDAIFQSEKLAALGRLAAGIAHELNNPLGIISSRIELMLLDAHDQGLAPEVVADLQVLHRNTQRAAHIARSLRSFARPSSAEFVPVSLNAVVRETLLLMEKPLTTDGMRLSTSLDEALPVILGDANALHQVLLNLLANARDAAAGRGEVRIETARADDHVRLVVADSGPGIAAEDLPNIFDPFFTTKSDGTGLGLSLSYGIVQAHHGTIDVQSALDRGTTFVLTFPLASPEAEPR